LAFTQTSACSATAASMPTFASTADLSYKQVGLGATLFFLGGLKFEPLKARQKTRTPARVFSYR
jgi:hypothetical protein